MTKFAAFHLTRARSRALQQRSLPSVERSGPRFPRMTVRALWGAGLGTGRTPSGRSTWQAVSTRRVSRQPSSLVHIIDRERRTIPVFSSLSAATRYHNAARRFASLSSLRRAACAYRIAVGGSSALKKPTQHAHHRIFSH